MQTEKTVYILDFGDQIKIGMTANFQKRLRSIETGSGRPVKQHFEAKVPKEYEKLLHEKLSEYRSLGEFFSYPYQKAVTLFKELLQQKAVKTIIPKLIGISTEQMINMAIAFKGISQATLARAIDMTPSNFNQKIKRDTFSKEELEKIAIALGASYKSYFEFPDGTKIGI